MACVIWQKKYSTKADSKDFSESHEYVVCYRKSDTGEIIGLQRSEAQENTYKNLDDDPRGSWASDNLLRTEERAYAIFPLFAPNGQEHWPPKGSSWRFNKEKMAEFLQDNRIWFGETGISKPRLKRFRSEVRDSIPPQTLWGFDQVGHTDEGTKELARLFDGTRAPFPSPKPVRLLQRLVAVGCDLNGIVLDFFAGSGTVAHAAWRQNAIDAGTRRLILIQLPESLDPDNKVDQATIESCDKLGKPRNIAELTKERLRRAGAKIAREAAKAAKEEEGKLFADSASSREQPLDLGFRVFKLASSNIRAWDPDASDLEATLEEHASNLKEGRTEQDILYEVLLKLGLDLCIPIETREFAREAAKGAKKKRSGGSSASSQHQVSALGGGALFVCLSAEVSREDVETLGLGILEWWRELDPAVPAQFVFRDSGFADDVAKANLTAILEQNIPSDRLAGIRSI